MKTPYRIEFLVVLLIWSTPTLAYLDPGTGSVMLQLILGGVAGLAVMGKLYWGRFLEFFGLRKPEASDSDADPSD